MNITHTWIIKKLTQKNDGTGTIVEVEFKIVSKDIETNTVAYANKFCLLETENIDPENFIPYSNLSEEQVIQFVRTTFGDEEVKKIENDLADEIINKINPPAPPVIVENLPWS